MNDCQKQIFLNIRIYNVSLYKAKKIAKKELRGIRDLLVKRYRFKRVR